MRVGVTTAPDRSVYVAAAMTGAGLEPVTLSCLRVEPAPPPVLDRVRRQAETADLVVVTSVRAARVTWPTGMPAGVPVAAVGEATAAEVRRLGGIVSVIGEAGGGDLIERLAGRVAGATVVLPRAAEVAFPLGEALEAAGARVLADPVYTTVPVGPPDDRVDGAAFGSPSAVEGWCLTRGLEGIVAGAIGETTRRALAARAAETIVVASRPRFSALAEALADAWAVAP